MRALALNGRGRIVATSIAALAAWLASAPSARADVTVKINYDFVETRVSPRAEVYRSHVSESYRISIDKGVGLSTTTSATRTQRAKLGETTPGFNETGQAVTTAYQITNGAVVVTTHNPGYFHVLRIITDGRTACSATRKYFRNPGHQYFEAVTMNGTETIMATNFTAENMTCSIGE
jgi:hypothetical protein